MFVIEGVDCTGKTTLIKELKKQCGLQEVKRYHTLPPKDYNDYEKYILETLNNSKPDQIIDRFYVGEFVYGPVIRKKIGFDWPQIQQIDKLWNEKNIWLIYCSLPINEIKRLWKERKQYPKEKNIEELLGRYNKVLHCYPFNRRLLAYNRMTKILDLYSIIDYIEEILGRSKYEHKKF